MDLIYCPFPMTHRIAVIGGDGLGPEVTAEAIAIIKSDTAIRKAQQEADALVPQPVTQGATDNGETQE